MDEKTEVSTVANLLERDGLALEYQRDYGTARGDRNVLDLVNNPAANGVCRVLRLSFPEKGSSVLFTDMGAFLNDGGPPVVPHPRPTFAVCGAFSGKQKSPCAAESSNKGLD